jgi:MFS family permease
MVNSDYKQPMLVGGLVVGLLSVIPIVSAGNCCFCLWALLGGAVAVKLAVDRSPQPVTPSEGAKIALMAGLCGAAIYFVGTLLLNLTALPSVMTLRVFETVASSTGNPELQAAMRQMIEQTQNQTVAQRMVGAVVASVVGGIFLVGFTVLGGLLGVALFEKRKGQNPPPPPPYTPPGYYPPAGPPFNPPPAGGNEPR